MYGITQWLTQLAAAVAQEKASDLKSSDTRGPRAVREQTQALLTEASKIKQPSSRKMRSKRSPTRSRGFWARGRRLLRPVIVGMSQSGGRA